jgi:hypothetical protein
MQQHGWSHHSRDFAIIRGGKVLPCWISHPYKAPIKLFKTMIPYIHHLVKHFEVPIALDYLWSKALIDNKLLHDDDPQLLGEYSEFHSFLRDNSKRQVVWDQIAPWLKEAAFKSNVERFNREDDIPQAQKYKRDYFRFLRNIMMRSRLAVAHKRYWYSKAATRKRKRAHKEVGSQTHD